MRGGYPHKTIQPVPSRLSDEEVISRILAIHQPHYVNPIMAKYTRPPHQRGVEPDCRRTPGPLVGQHQMHAVHAFYQAAGLSARDRSLIGAWIAIDDAHVGNGCMWVLPGSQQRGYPKGNDQDNLTNWPASGRSNPSCHNGVGPGRQEVAQGPRPLGFAERLGPCQPRASRRLPKDHGTVPGTNRASGNGTSIVPRKSPGRRPEPRGVAPPSRRRRGSDPP